MIKKTVADERAEYSNKMGEVETKFPDRVPCGPRGSRVHHAIKQGRVRPIGEASGAYDRPTRDDNVSPELKLAGWAQSVDRDLRENGAVRREATWGIVCVRRRRSFLPDQKRSQVALKWARVVQKSFLYLEIF